MRFLCLEPTCLKKALPLGTSACTCKIPGIWSRVSLSLIGHYPDMASMPGGSTALMGANATAPALALNAQLTGIMR